jgi:preprotein translocase subunit SecB
MNNQEYTEENAPHISVQAQYIKDFSFENPNAPMSFLDNSEAPQINLSLDLNINQLPDEDHYEVELYLNAHATKSENTMFLVDLRYAGVFYLANIPQEQKQMLLAIHCPGIIFPYARQIIGDATQRGGFQPLMIDPVDFGLLYAKKVMQEKQNQ